MNDTQISYLMHCAWCLVYGSLYVNKSHHNFESNVNPSIQTFISIFTMPNKTECHTHLYIDGMMIYQSDTFLLLSVQVNAIFPSNTKYLHSF